jgi:hypothetical protein
MKTIIQILMGVMLSLGLPAQSESTAAKANALYRQGLLALEQGQTETARTCFEGVLSLQPSNANARYQLRKLSLTTDRMGAKRRELKMQAVKLPKVDFEDLTLREALDAINAVVEKQTEGKFSPNFVVEDPNSVFETRRFTLKLGQVPASVALKYALDSARATARYDEHAIVIKPLGAEGAEVPQEGGEGAPAIEEQQGGKRAADPFAR